MSRIIVQISILYLPATSAFSHSNINLKFNAKTHKSQIKYGRNFHLFVLTLKYSVPSAKFLLRLPITSSSCLLTRHKLFLPQGNTMQSIIIFVEMKTNATALTFNLNLLLLFNICYCPRLDKDCRQQLTTWNFKSVFEAT
jgi:hypothetical protein